MSQRVDELEELINQGRYFEARSRAEDILKKRNLPRVRQLFALAISKSGMPELALEAITPLYQQFPDDPESAGILGSIYKELFKKNQKTSFAVQSRDTYLKNFQATQNYYTGINAASMAAMAGQSSKGREIANEVISIVQRLELGFWEAATLGEAFLLVKDKPKAIERYADARKLAGNDWGKVSSVHNQLWLLNHYIAVPGEVMKLFAPPNVVAFSGHMIDQPGRPTPRFPKEIEPQVKDSIRNSIRTLNARIGYSSLACGSDILFVESMIEEGGEVNLILPFHEDDFIKTSLAFAGQTWVDRFKKIVSLQPIQYSTRGQYGNNDELFTFLSRAIYGKAILRSGSTHSEPYLLTVSSEMDLKRKTGGTKDTVDRWPFPQRHLNINPDIYTAHVTQPAASPPSEPIKFSPNTESLTYLVYLGFDSELLELKEKIGKYKENTEDDTMGLVALIEGATSTIASFRSSSAAIEFVSSILENKLLGRSINSIKIALHAGLVQTPAPNEIRGAPVNELTKMGSQVAAGSVYASELFASLLALNVKEYFLQYAGVVSLAENTLQPFYNVEILH